MAEAILFDLAAGIIEKLASQAFKSVALCGNVEKALDNLKDTFSTIQAVVVDAEQRQSRSHEVKDWLRKLKDVVYDVDDLLDELSTEASRQKLMSRRNRMTEKVRTFFSSSNQLAYGLKLGRKIQRIRQRLDKIADDRNKFHLKELPETHVENGEWRQTYSFVLEEEVIGRENDREEIIELLLDSNVKENVSIIPIVGIGGLGKTTLAQLVFNDGRITSHFELKVWVCVSDEFDLKRIVEKILESVTEKEVEKIEMPTLQKKLRKSIDGKRYLLVLDDVWNEDQGKWDDLKRLLTSCARGSKLILTTRSEKVAKITGTISPYHLLGLSDSQSQSLLLKTAFKDEEEKSKYSNLSNIGKEIADKCLGVPLAIKSVGRVLYFKRAEIEWLNVNNNEHLFITQYKNSILPILKLSYDHLPSHLKHCFAYCSLFPKDYEINRQTLISLWISQGFIQPMSEVEQMEDVGHEYFMDLVWRSFFQEVKEDGLGNVLSCKIHDLMHELSRSVAGGQCAVMKSRDENVDERVRHVSFDDNLESLQEIPTDLFKAKKIRTFLLPTRRWVTLNRSKCKTIMSAYKHLRALDLHDSSVDEVSHSIGKLKHLRYLDLSYNKFERLPRSVCRIHNLQTLSLYGCHLLVELPTDIWKMVNLRHIINDHCISLSRMPKGLGKLTSLQTLSLFVVSKRDCLDDKHSGGLSELNALNNLRGELEIKNLDNAIPAECKGANLSEKAYLQSLKLEWSFSSSSRSDDNLILEGLQPHPNLRKLKIQWCQALKFPDWLSSLTNIVKIGLNNCNKCEYLPPLDQLSSLKILNLRGLRDLEWISCDKPSSASTLATFFPSLEVLSLRFCDNLKGWWKMDDDDCSSNDGTTPTASSSSLAMLPSFPVLSKLEITRCPNLISMPLYPSLEQCELHSSSSKSLLQTMKMQILIDNAAPSTSSSPPASLPLCPLSKLKSLVLVRIENLEFLPHEGLQNLTSLQSLLIKQCPNLVNLGGRGYRGLNSLHFLYISECNKLKSLSGVFQCVTALEKLEIEDCEELDLPLEDGVQWQGLRSLQTLSILKLPKLVSLSGVFQHVTALGELHISGCKELQLSSDGIQFKNSRSLRYFMLNYLPKLERLPDWLQDATNLEELWIYVCDNLMTLPEWIANLTSLERLHISCSPKLGPLPQGMRQLNALRYFSIWDCPQLSERCKSNMAVDLPLIAHVPDILIDRVVIQSSGRYSWTDEEFPYFSNSHL